MERLICTGKEGDFLVIGGQEFNHLKALRVKKGDRLEVFCEGRLFLSILLSIEKGYALCKPLEEINIPLPKPEVNLYQCIPLELRLMEEVIDRASQTGANLLIPLVCKRGFQKLSVVEEKLERWKKLSLASFKQCKRPKPMEIGRPIRLYELEAKEEVSLVLDNFSAEADIKSLDLTKRSYGVLVGPEGGLSIEEVETLKSKGFKPLFLRPYVLRMEMAGAVATALIMNLAGKS
ncbi:RsmE family RNA methyltransferase [Hydrogenobacter sp. T-2]|uniref:RsmE family RNA methyltransferase n=1 Tax=Pampinifervens diazotrophicum TaxID=1632018 RepID=UPI002B25AB04|nr:RsmE family RNA methyltransferase [Hydrogenobacter sp. T-2]WPM31587.1 RsmE family RNA methyltransferase [Hydrogenobacter sp. T-2]